MNTMSGMFLPCFPSGAYVVRNYEATIICQYEMKYAYALIQTQTTKCLQA